MAYPNTNEELPVEMQAMPAASPKPRHVADPLHDYRNEHLELQEKLAEMWGAEQPYTPVVEETGSFFQRFYYGWAYDTILLATKERLRETFLPPPTKDSRARECGLRISRSLQKAMYNRNAWSCMVGTAVVSTLDPASRGVLRWVGVPQQGGYTRMMAGVEWSVPPAVRTAARSDDGAASPFFDGVVHGEHLFTPEHSDMSTLEEVTDVNLDLSSRGGVVEIPTPGGVPLVWILVRGLSYYLLIQNPFLLVSNLCSIGMPLMLKKFVVYLSAEKHTWWGGLSIVVAIFILQAVQSVCLHRYNFLSTKSGAQLRSALNTIVFEKCLIISSKSLAQPEMNAGRIINMVGTDVERAYFFMQFVMSFWSSPMMLLLALAQLYQLVGWCTVLAVIAFFLVLPLNGRLVMQMRNARKSLSKATDIRVKAANEFFSGIRVAKFMTWEPRFITNIEAKRATEIFFLKRIQYTRVATTFLNNATPMVMIALVFTLYYATGHTLTATVVFPTIALLGILREPFHQIPWVFTMMVQFMIAMGRITKFLECDNSSCSSVQHIGDYFKEQHLHSTACQLAAVLENVDVTAYVPVKLPFAPKIKMTLISRVLRMVCCEQCKPVKRYPAPTDVVEESSPVGSPHGSPRGGSAKQKGAPNIHPEEYFQLEPKTLLRNVSLEVPKGKLTLVLGATGSGKSTLLQALLSQFEITQGRVWTEKSIAYVPQQPWIMNATVRGNILFFDDEDEGRLTEAIRVSQLQTDLQLLGAGLETEIGEKGVNLSGGQKARVSLARAVYANREVYLLDDPLSALDAHVGERVVEECFLGALAGKTRVLATHQMHVVPKADYVIALGDGCVTFSGSSADFMSSAIFAVMATEHKPPELEKASREDRVTESEDTAPSAETKETSSVSKDSQTKDVDVAEGEPEGDDGNAPVHDGKLTTKEEKARGSVPIATYFDYFRFCGGTHVAAMIVAIYFVTELLSVSSSVWLSLWSTDHYHLATEKYLIVYLVLVVLGTASSPLRLSVAFTAMRRGCTAMHRKLLRTVATGTMEFFDSTPMGRLMSRFSRDIDMIDNGVQMTLQNTLDCVFSITSSMLVTLCSQPMVIVVLIPAGVFYYFLMIFYNSANREARRFTSVMKTPVFTLLTELTSGAQTIAAFGKSAVVMQQALKRLDIVFSCTLLENTLRQWVAVRIEFLSNVIVTSIALAGVVSCMTRFGSNNVGLISLSLTMAMQTTGQLNWLVRMAAAAEADMNSVERIQYYIQNTPTEEMPTIDEEVDALEKKLSVDTNVTGTVVIESVSPSSLAPHTVKAGSLVFDKVQMRYREGLPLVLRDVSFGIAPREKVGIVGRTGSGKSTLLLTFMRMVEICGGDISVNGRGIGTYGLRELRRQFSMIPQDPVLFDGTVRLNVDPFLEASSSEVWHALELVGLRERVASETEGIDGRVLEGGSNFSVGQRQLMCMARALLKKGSGFILMDEATANIDPALDRQIQTTVMSAFAEYTVITIAHRLHTVAQYDKIIVMDHGVVAEMGSPRDLVMNRQSVFRGMVDAMGEDSASRFVMLVESAGRK